jgi:Hemerythrin HHE cation binding domain
MTVDTKGFRKAHREVCERAADLRRIAFSLPTLDMDERERTRRRVLDYLAREVDTHMRVDELVLYPEVAHRVGDPLVACSMRYDHLAIRHWIDDFAAADIADTALMQELLYGLDALIRVHVWKENELFLDPLETGSWPG